MAVWTQIEDGVFLDALDKQAEVLLTLAQGLFRLSALRDILEGNAHNARRLGVEGGVIQKLPDGHEAVPGLTIER